MPQTEDQIVAAALELPPEARTSIAERLLDSVEGSPEAELDPVWKIEIRRRLRAIDDGTATMIPEEEVFRLLAEQASK
jgi:putative addiction module component (TIGR02574 family)